MRVVIFSTVVIFLICLSCQAPVPEDPAARFQPIIDRYVEVWNGGDPGLLDSVIDPGVVRKPMTGPMAVGANNLEELKQVIREFRASFPDFKVTILDVMAQGEKTAVRWSVKGTNTGEGQFPATGKSIDFEGVSISTYANGKLVEELVYFDTMVMATQLGYTVSPPTPPGEEAGQ